MKVGGHAHAALWYSNIQANYGVQTSDWEEKSDLYNCTDIYWCGANINLTHKD